MTQNITPLKASVNLKFLYDGDILYDNQYTDCLLIAISAYVNQTPTFHIMVGETGAIYSDIPFHALLTKKDIPAGTVLMNLPQLVYSNCKTGEIEVFENSYLKLKTPKCFFKSDNLWIEGKYLFSVDFYTGNDLFHTIKLETGQIAAVPNHKINWNGDCLLPDYKKNHTTWVI